MDVKAEMVGFGKGQLVNPGQEVPMDTTDGMQALADTISVMVWNADARGYVTWYNKRWYEYTGLSFEESKGRRWQKLADPSLLPQIIARWDHCLNSGEPFEMVFELRGANGDSRPFLVNGQPQRGIDGRIVRWFGTCTDLAAQRDREDGLRHHNERLQLLSNAASLLLASTDPQHMVKELFDKICSHLKADLYFNFMVNAKGDALELDSSTGIPEEAQRFIKRLDFGQAVCGTVANVRTPCIYANVQELDDDKTALVRSYGVRSYACFPLLAENRLLGTLSFGSRTVDAFSPDEIEFMQTVAHYVALAKERHRVEHELRDALDRSEAASVAKSEFLANMSHEIRTPMNAVVGLANLLQMDDLPVQKQREFLRTLQLSAQHLLQLINDLLDISRLESNQVQLDRTPFRMDELVKEVASIHEVRAKEKHLRLLVQLPETDEAEIFLGDPVRIRQILMNLLSNAVKFTEQGQVIVNVAFEPREDNQMMLYLDISDTGIGIPPQHLEAIFHKFTQADGSATRKYGGTGLGLSICRTLTEMMGGQISVHSTPGKGSCFSLAIPLQTQRKLATVPTKQATDEPRSTPVKILLVEDYWANVLVATAILDNLGYRYEVAENGLEAVRKYTSEEFQAVLMDVQMPDMDGIAATHSIREWEQKRGTNHTPIIGMTAHALKGDRERCLSAGMDDYISKPFQPIELEQKLKHYCQSQTEAA
jgi:PAS domain S-box-containing protein